MIGIIVVIPAYQLVDIGAVFGGVIVQISGIAAETVTHGEHPGTEVVVDADETLNHPVPGADFHPVAFTQAKLLQVAGVEISGVVRHLE